MKQRNWKRIAAWTTAGFLVAAAGLMVGLFALLHSARFHEYLSRTAQQRVSEMLGVQVRIRDFSLRLSTISPSVDIYDLVVDGASPYQNQPLLEADHLRLGIRITSLVHRQWNLADVVMDHPIVHVLVDSSGGTNLPGSKADSTGRASVFDLGARHVMFSQGEFYYNDRKSLIDADLHDLAFRSNLSPTAKRYSGGLSYHDGRIQLQGLEPVVHSLEAEFDATPEGINLKRGTLTSGASQVAVTGTLGNFLNPRIQATYRASLNSAELRKMFQDLTIPVGVVNLTGSALYQSGQNRTLLEALSLDGNLSSDALQVHTDTIHTQARKISAHYKLAKGDLDVYDVQASVLGGTLTGSIMVHDVAGAQESRLHAVLHQVGLGGIQSLANPQSMWRVRVTGTANAIIDSTWHKTLDTLMAHTDVNLKGTIAPPKVPAATTVAGEIHADYSAVTRQVSFARTTLRLQQTAVNLNGTVGNHSSMQVQFDSSDLHEVETVAAAFGATTQPLGLYGTASFTGTVQGSTTDPQIAGRLSAAGLKVKGTELQKLRTNLDASSSHVNLRDGELQLANNRGQITFNVNLGLEHWSFRDTNPIQIDFDASEINLTDLRNLAGSQAPISGTLSAKASLHGSMLKPIGQGTMNLTQATLADEPVQSVNVTFHGTDHEIHTRIALRMAAGAVQGEGTYFPEEQRYNAQLEATGIRLDQFRTLTERNLQVSGVINLTARGNGTISDPAFQLTIDTPRIQIRNQRIEGVKLQANVSNHTAEVTLDSQAINASLHGHGKVKLTAPYYADIALDTLPISLQAALATYLPAQAENISGETEIHAMLRGPLKDPALVEAHLTIPTLTLAYKDNLQLAAVAPIQLNYSRNVLTLDRTTIRGTGTDLTLEGTIPLNDSTPVSLLAVGTIDLRLAQLLAPDITSSGQIQFNITSLGQRASPSMQGQIKVVNATFAGDSLPLGLQNGNGVLNLTNNRLEIARFEGTVGSGTLTATGAVTYRPSLQFNLSIAGNGVRLLYPQGVRESVDANLTMTGSPESALLRGQVRLTDLSFSPTFDLADIIGRAATPSTVPMAGFARNLQLDIRVQSENDARVTSTKLSVEGAANLRVRGTAAEPVVLGRVNLNGGDMIFRGTRYILQPSTLDFVNPYKIEPRVSLAVDTTVQQYNIHLLFRGTVDQLRTTYSSDPALPPSDIINLLVFGKTSESSDANGTLGDLGAESLIASSVSSQLTNRIENFAGVSQLSIDPILGSNQQSSGARVTIQQRVTGNLFVTFAADPTSTQREVVKLEYQATPRVSISGVRDQNGGFALDIRLHKIW